MVLDWDSSIGHVRQKEELSAMLREGRLPHALLFTGPAGIGKRLVARSLAAAILCTGERLRPCGTCESCRLLAADSNEDYFELVPEAAGKAKPVIRIDAVRSAVARTIMTRSSGPAEALGRVLVIDEADLMNEPAANSLLKTLEEPPAAVTFILLTEKPSALLVTIRSRCIPIPFGALSQEEVEEALGRLGETGEAAHAAACLSAGSVRMALRLVENDSKALLEEVLELLEEAPRLPMLEVFRRAEDMGKWERSRQSEWLGIFALVLRDILLLTLDGGGTLLLGDTRRDRLLALSQGTAGASIHPLLALTEETERRLQTNANPRLLFEGFLIRLRDICLSEICRVHNVNLR